MKLNKISRAVGLACVAMSATSAFALNASLWTSGNTSNIYISGASAQDNGILVFALKNCAAGSMHRYSISNNFVYFCTPIAALGQTSTNNQVAIHKYSVGGSGGGVAPVNSASSLPFLDLSDIAANCTTSLTAPNAAFGTWSGTVNGYYNVACTAASTLLTTAVPTRLGVSDVEPDFFTTQTGNLTAEPISTLIFGVPVSTNVYRALQSAQGLATGYCTNQVSTVATGTVTATQQWEYLNECMPALTRAQIVSAFTQGGLTWAGIGVTGVAGNIYVARRVNSSGTQKTFEALIARSPNGVQGLKSCIGVGDPFVLSDFGTDDTETGDTANRCQTGAGLATVFAGSGGGNVRTCLTDHAAGGRGAIGILTAEDIAPSGANGWRFVKVAGGTPSASNRGGAPRDADVASGGYTFWTVSSLNYTSFATGNTNYNNFLTKFKSDFADPTGIQILQPFGLSGNMANYSQLADPKPARDFTGASGLNPWDRLVGSQTLDNCQQGKATNF